MPWSAHSLLSLAKETAHMGLQGVEIAIVHFNLGDREKPCLKQERKKGTVHIVRGTWLPRCSHSRPRELRVSLEAIVCGYFTQDPVCGGYTQTFLS